MIEESVQRNREAMKLIMKVIPNWKHYLYTGFGISSSYYGGENERLTGTGQDNKFSGDLCRDISCLIIREIERKRLGMFIESNVTKTAIQRVLVAFVDDADLVTDRDNAERKMRKMAVLYNDLYVATGGFSKKVKSKYFLWKWVVKEGRKIIKNVEKKVEVNHHKIMQIHCNESVKTLGVMIGPSLKWDE